MRRARASVAVVAIRDDGRRIVFSRCDSEASARNTVAALRKLGLRAAIDRDLADDLKPGSNVSAT
jgi:hypothetical protein